MRRIMRPFYSCTAAEIFFLATRISFRRFIQSTIIALACFLELPRSIAAETAPNDGFLLPSPAAATPKAGTPSAAEARAQLETARRLVRTRQTAQAAPILVELLGEAMPESVKQSALLELALVAQEENEIPRAQQIYAQFVSKWPDDIRAPEILLKQGHLFRQMGLNSLALAKFYGVMTSALVLKNDKLDYYQRLVLQAQIEIADTAFLLGKYSDSADFYSRLLKQNNSSLDRPEIQFKLVRSLAALDRHDEVVGQAQDYLEHYSNSPNQPEVRFHLALALKHLAKNEESLRQVLLLLHEQKSRTLERPEWWAYWQQRAGNEIANQLYREGDYPRALDVYLSLEQLDHSPPWQLPVAYQIGMTYERLSQPEKAATVYRQITQRETEAGTNASPGMKALLEMAKWRARCIEWQKKAEAINRALSSPVFTNSISVSQPSNNPTGIIGKGS
jgi:TolA-binding protein